jgi:hypothetical protein
MFGGGGPSLMAVLACPRCQIRLTLRPPWARERDYCFPHADDCRGCDTCGTIFCEPCGEAIGERCPDCGGILHPNQTFPAKGKYRLFYPPLVRLHTADERVAWVNRRWDAGTMSKIERAFLLAIIAELADGEEARA